ncbi:MAG: hypothetical protein ACKPBU_09045 [Alphaproteobacteria bacterium]
MAKQTPSDIESVLDELAASGQITRAKMPKGDWTWKVTGLGLPEGTAAALLDELREER